MDLTNLSTIKKLCQKYKIRPSKKLGQNFLINKNILDKIVIASELKKDDVVLEIGPGFGVLTRELVSRVKQVVTVEKDKRLVEHLNTEALKHLNTLKIIEGDVLKLDISKNLQVTKYKLISNLPYQITSPVLWKFLHYDEVKPELMVLMMQKEVAERIVVRPGKMSVLSVMCQFYAEPEIISLVGKENFYPIPNIDSAIIKLKLKIQLAKHKELNEKNFIKLVKIGFSAKRKMLKNNLTCLPARQANGLKISPDKVVKILKKVGLDEKIRAQELSVENWLSILACL